MIPPDESVAQLFRLLGQPVRIQILLVIEQAPACVCHIEACLGMRQAAISQHLMQLRDAGLVEARREGRNVYYALAQPGLMGLVRQAAGLLNAGLSTAPEPMACPCPRCNPDQPEINCSSEACP